MFLASENIDFTGLSHVFLLGGGETDPLIKKAVTTYVKAEFGLDNEDADRLRASYKEQRNGLSLSDSYIAAEGG